MSLTLSPNVYDFNYIELACNVEVVSFAIAPLKSSSLGRRGRSIKTGVLRAMSSF